MDWLTELYANTMNIIHFMHDKYNYERVMMALHDSHVRRLLAFGVAGLSVITDSLSAMKYAKVRCRFWESARRYGEILGAGELDV